MVRKTVSGDETYVITTVHYPYNLREVVRKKKINLSEVFRKALVKEIAERARDTAPTTPGTRITPCHTGSVDNDN